MLVGERTVSSSAYKEAQDHNVGVFERRSLHAYLKEQSRPAKKLFRELVRDPRVAKLLDESMAVVRRRQEEPRKGDRSAYDQMMRIRSRESAAGQARKLYDLLPFSAERQFAVQRRSASRPGSRTGRPRRRSR